MPVEVASGRPGMSGGYIPEIWSGKLLEKFYPATFLAQIANTDYEGEIANMGDKVIIRTTPNMITKKYVIGQPLVVDSPKGEKVVLNIDQGEYYAFSVSDVEKMQSDINFMNAWATDAAQQQKIAVERQVLDDIIYDPDVANAGTNAGVISGSIDLGETGDPVALSKADIIDKIVECNQVLDEQNRPEDGRWMILPAWATTRIKTSDIKDASLTGDGKSILRTGRIGMIDRFTIYSSNLIKFVTDGASKAFYCPFGHRSALTFASQFVKAEMLKHPNDFGDIQRGLQVYGYEVLQPKSMGVLYAKAA